jgi:hypothetical protein
MLYQIFLLPLTACSDDHQESFTPRPFIRSLISSLSSLSFEVDAPPSPQRAPSRRLVKATRTEYGSTGVLTTRFLVVRYCPGSTDVRS